MTEQSSSLQKIYSTVFEEELLKEIEEKCLTITAPAGQTLMNMGQPVSAVPLVVKGVAKVSRINDEGQEFLLYYVKEGEGCAIAFACGMMGQPSAIKSTVEEDITIMFVPLQKMEQWMTKYPSWKKFVMDTMVTEFIDVIKNIDNIAFKKMDDRLISYLKEKSRIIDSPLLNISHQQIADEMGTNRVVISRLLKKLENDKKLILFRNQIKLLNDL
jgi:CRP/FNR family transcriptional regulator